MQRARVSQRARHSDPASEAERAGERARASGRASQSEPESGPESEPERAGERARASQRASQSEPLSEPERARERTRASQRASQTWMMVVAQKKTFLRPKTHIYAPGVALPSETLVSNICKYIGNLCFQMIPPNFNVPVTLFSLIYRNMFGRLAAINAHIRIRWGQRNTFSQRNFG